MNPSSSSMALISCSSSSSSSSSSSMRKRDSNSYGDESDCKRPKNDVNLHVGHDARFEVFKAIDESEISLVVFSPNYASSKECLDELVHIKDCVARYPDHRKVLPVFLNVEPSDVRNQEGHDFKEPFEAHKISTDPETVKNWKQALKDVGKLAGRALKDFRNEAELVLGIVNQIGEMLSPQDIHVTDHPVGIRSRSEELISKLQMFWSLEFLELLNKDGKVAFCQSFDGVTKIQHLLRCKKTLLVVDDVDHFERLEVLGIVNPQSFYKGSRIIVTTRDVDSLGGIPHTSYHTRLLNERESRKLFIPLMFAIDEPVHANFVKEAVACAGGLPLVLKQLQMSYDSLSPDEKNLFMDIACFFNGMKKGLVIKVLSDEYFSADFEIEKLAHKFLVENKGYLMSLPHVIKEMGHEVVRQEDSEDPGTESVRSIRLDYDVNRMEEEATVQFEAFQKMSSLRFIMLQIEDLQQSFTNVVNGLNATRSSWKINFRTMVNPDKVDNSDFILPMATVNATKHKFENTLVGFFVGKKVAFPLVKNYVTNTWNKFGFKKIIGDDEGVFYFKFATSKGLEQGRVGYARALIKVLADKELKQEVTMAIPTVEEEVVSHTLVKIQVEYEWKPPICVDCKVFGHASHQCPKCIPTKVVPTEEIHEDGFTVEKNSSAGSDNGIKLKNLFEKLNECTVIVEPEINSVKGKKTSDGSVDTQDRKEEEYDSEIEDMVMEENPSTSKPIGAITPYHDVLNVYFSVCAILKSHVDISTLSKVCSKVFRSSDWTSNGGLCPNGCRIIVGWNVDIVHVMVLAQSTQALHVKVIHKETNKTIFCSFIYAGNKQAQRRLLWRELGAHKNVVRRYPWTLMGDFNVALNMEDTHAGSSSMNSAMCEFKDCVSNIEVLDVTSSGLHYTWNQKPRSGDGVLKKLDRIMANLDLIDSFPGVHAIFQPYRISDHSLVVLKFPSLCCLYFTGFI
ncbi:TMV resistance protein N [Tanacetum coccineum]